MQTQVGTLATGDYSVKGFEDIVVVERKSLGDLISCMTTGRERFEKELHRLQAYPTRCVVIEGTWSDLEEGRYRSKLNPKGATHTVASWIGRFNVPFQFVENRDYAAHFVQQFLFHEVKRFLARSQKVVLKIGVF